MVVEQFCKKYFLESNFKKTQGRYLYTDEISTIIRCLKRGYRVGGEISAIYVYNLVAMFDRERLNIIHHYFCRFERGTGCSLNIVFFRRF